MKGSVVLWAFSSLLILPMATVFCSDCRISLPAGYVKDRPEVEAEGAVTKPYQVDVVFRVHDVQKIDDHDLTYTIDVAFALSWIDRRFKTPGSKKKICMFNETEEEQLWKPNFYIYNTADSNGLYGDRTGVVSVLRLVPEEGRFLHTAEMMLRIRCDMHFSHYPMDSQTCHFQAGSLITPSTEIVYNGTYFVQDRVETRPRPFTFSFSKLSARDKRMRGRSVTGFTITFVRRVNKFTINVFLPTAVMVFVSFISFIIPVEMIPGRMALLVTIFLMLVNISNSERSIGPESETMTALDVWMLSCMTFLAAELMEYAVVLWLTYRKKKGVDDESSRGGGKRKMSAKTLCWHMDEKALIIFPVANIFFNAVYWIYFMASR